MSKTRKSARNEPCLIRLPGCSGGGADTVLCHYRMLPYNGSGMKPDDDLGAYGCNSCHGIADGRLKPPDGYTKQDVKVAFLEGVLRTWMRRKERHEDG